MRDVLLALPLSASELEAIDDPAGPASVAEFRLAGMRPGLLAAQLAAPTQLAISNSRYAD